MIIGNKLTFAIEFHPCLNTSPLLGRICYWIGGETYGDINLYSTLGLLGGGIDLQKDGVRLFLKKDLRREMLNSKDFEDISAQLLEGRPLLFSYEYIVKSIAIEAAESFDGFSVFLFQNKELTTWVVAEDTLEQRYSCIKIGVNEVQEAFIGFSEQVRNLLPI